MFATSSWQPLVAFTAEMSMLAILVISAVIAIVTAFKVFFSSDELTGADIDKYATSSYLDHAAVGAIVMALGFTPMAAGWFGVALIRAAIVFWAQDNRNAV